MKKIIKYLCILALTATYSCNYMDVVPDMIATIEGDAFSMKSQAEKVYFTCYSYLPELGTANDPAMLGGDEIWLSPYDLNFYGSGRNMVMGYQSSTAGYFDYWRGTGGGKNLYRGISDCNIFLANIDRVPDMSEAERKRWKAEVEILKVYYHFYLIRMFGPIPIKDVNLSIQAGTEETHVFRNTLDECFDYVIGRIDEVIKRDHLDPVIQDMAQGAGRITKAIALVLKAKAAIYRASPLFNGNTSYAGLKDKRGVEIFCPTKTEEQKRQRWVEAREYCREAVEFLQANGMAKLYSYTGNGSEFAAGLSFSDRTRQVLTIRLALTEPWNSDIVWGNSNTWNNDDFQRQSYPRELHNLKNTEYRRQNFSVPIKILEMFYTKNGVPIDEDKTWNFNARFAVRTADNDQMYHLAVGEITAGIHFDREPRYYASIGFDRGVWYGQGEYTNQTYYVQARNGEFASNAIMHSWNSTGMWPKKLVHPKMTIKEGGSANITYSRYPFPFMRLSEVYLMYAEALNEADPSQAARDEAIGWVDSVRHRAGLRGVKESWEEFSNNPEKPNSQDGLREIIKSENMSEFAFEGHRFWDLRRWMDAYREYNRPITGWTFKYKDPMMYYVQNLLHQTRFTPRDYFWPIADDEVLRNPNTLQNYGW